MNRDALPVVLIVEDEREVALSMKLHLEELGYPVQSAYDGGKGLAMLRELHPGAVLLDLRMPVMDGLDVLKHATEEFPEMPVIVVSGKGMMVDVITALRLGAWDYLMKPLDDIEVLGHSLSRALERSRLIKENRRYREHLEEEVTRRTAQLEQANQALQIKQMALTEVLGAVEIEKNAVGQQVTSNVEKVILPLVRSLKEGLSRPQQKVADQVEKALEEIVSPFSHKLSKELGSLTPAEVRICNLVRNGLGVKEIAEMERLSPETIAAHRRNIRRKLGVAHKKVNLTTYLRTLMHDAGAERMAMGKVELMRRPPK